MRVVSAFLNKAEEIVYKELNAISVDNGLRVFAKPRLSDIVDKGKSYLSKREFDFYSRSHLDFVLVNPDNSVRMALEYDGPFHSSSRQSERDKIKNSICQNAGLGLLRIGDQHVTKLYGGMSVLRWIVEVTNLQESFYEAQRKGLIPQDEPFDPTTLSITQGDNVLRNPYWLSASANEKFRKAFASLPREMPKGHSSVMGIDEADGIHRLSCFYQGDQVVFAKTSVRNQQLDFPHDDLSSELDTCELGLKFEKCLSGELRYATRAEFSRVFERFCMRYSANPSHLNGGFPCHASWGFGEGWCFNEGKRSPQ